MQKEATFKNKHITHSNLWSEKKFFGSRRQKKKQSLEIVLFFSMGEMVKEVCTKRTDWLNKNQLSIFVIFHDCDANYLTIIFTGEKPKIM